jgi:hypothetical protein
MESIPRHTLDALELPRVTELLIDGLPCVSAVETLASTRWLHCLPALQTLILYQATFTRAAFSSLLLSLPRLRRIDVVSADVDNWDESSHTSLLPSSIALQEFHLSGPGTAEFLGLLAILCRDADVRLTELHSGSCGTAADLVALNELLRQSPTLQYLEVYLLYNAEEAGEHVWHMRTSKLRRDRRIML